MRSLYILGVIALQGFICKGSEFENDSIKGDFFVKSYISKIIKFLWVYDLSPNASTPNQVCPMQVHQACKFANYICSCGVGLVGSG